MSVSTEITRLQTAREAIKTAIAGKGVTVPANAKLADLSALVQAIPQTGSSKLFLIGEDTLTCQMRSFKETNASVTVNDHSVVFSKTSNTDGGSGMSSYWKVDVTSYNSLVIEAAATDIRNTTTPKYIPHVGLSDSYITTLSNVTYTASTNLCNGGDTSFAKKTVTLDVSGLSGNYYVTYQGIAALTITKLYLE